MSALHRVAECAVLAAGMGRSVTQIGPFKACLDPSTDFVYLNYAVPVWALGTEEETREQLDQLRAVFHSSQRRLRFEFVDGVWPDLPRALEKFGLELQAKTDLMSSTPETLRVVAAPGVEVKIVDADDLEAHRTFYEVQRSGFGMEEAASAEELAQLRHQISNDFWRCAIAFLDGQPAGAGTILPAGSVCELAGVATLAGARRRGVAATLSSFLVAQHFSTGGDLTWLTAMTSEARATYLSIGFADLGVQWNYIEPPVSFL